MKTWNLSQPYAVVLIIIATSLAPSTRVLFARVIIYLICFCFVKVTVLAPFMRTFFCYWPPHIHIRKPVTRGVRRGAKHPKKVFRPPGKICWILFESIGHSLKKLGHSQTTLRAPWCPKLATGLHARVFWCVPVLFVSAICAYALPDGLWVLRRQTTKDKIGKYVGNNAGKKWTKRNFF